VEVKKIASISAANSAIFVPDATKDSYPNGDSVLGAMGQDLIQKTQSIQQKFVIMVGAGTVEENL